MKSKYKYILLIVLAFICLSAFSASAEIAIPAKPYNHVVDLAGIIDDNTETALNRYLLELEQKTTAQMIILTITSLEGQSIEDLSIDIAHKKWRLGQKGRDNGILLLVSLQDRKYRFETGYGLEGVLPDSLLGSIGRQYLVPYFQKGDYSNGIAAAALVVITTIARDAGVEISGMPRLQTRASSRGTRGKPTLPGIIFGILFLIGVLYLLIRHPRLLLFLIMANLLGGGRRGGWGGSGGFGGGGGSFGGGGGGGFGGGGASGGW